jgi:hypothetical protein
VFRLPSKKAATLESVSLPSKRWQDKVHIHIGSPLCVNSHSFFLFRFLRAAAAAASYLCVCVCCCCLKRRERIRQRVDLMLRVLSRHLFQRHKFSFSALLSLPLPLPCSLSQINTEQMRSHSVYGEFITTAAISEPGVRREISILSHTFLPHHHHHHHSVKNGIFLSCIESSMSSSLRMKWQMRRKALMCCQRTRTMSNINHSRCSRSCFGDAWRPI